MQSTTVDRAAAEPTSVESTLEIVAERLRSKATAPLFVLVAAALTLGVGIGVFLGSGDSSLPLVTLVCAPLQIALFVVLRRFIAMRRMALTVTIGFAWMVYFTLRMLVTQSDRTNLNENEIVRAAGDESFVWAWLLSTAALAAFAAGAALVGAGKPSAKFVPDLSIDTLFWFATIGLFGRTAMVFGNVASGFIENIMSLYLLAFAALGYHSVTVPNVRRRLYVLVAIASSLGVLTSFKEAAVIPIAALAVGMAGAGVKLGPKRVGLMLGLGLAVFLAIQGNRFAFDDGEPISLFEGPIVALTKYDFESGVRAEPGRTTLDAATSVAKGMSRRFGGVTAVILLREQVPGEIDHLGGDSIWQPAVSAIPVVSGQVDLDFRILSLGRYFTTTFIAPDQQENTSSQAITMLGDLYLNFGDAGVLIGFLLWGVFVGGIDRTFPPTSATRVGAIVYLGHVLIGIERNVAYLGVNVAIRLTILLLVLRGVARWGDRMDTPSRVLGTGAR